MIVRRIWSSLFFSELVDLTDRGIFIGEEVCLSTSM